MMIPLMGILFASWGRESTSKFDFIIKSRKYVDPCQAGCIAWQTWQTSYNRHQLHQDTAAMKISHASKKEALTADGRLRSRSHADGSIRHLTPAASIGPSHSMCIWVVYAVMVRSLACRHLLQRLRSHDKSVSNTKYSSELRVAVQFGLILWRIYWTPAPLTMDASARLFSEERALQHAQKLAGEIGERQVAFVHTLLLPVRALQTQHVCAPRSPRQLWTRLLGTYEMLHTSLWIKPRNAKTSKFRCERLAVSPACRLPNIAKHINCTGNTISTYITTNFS